MYSSPIEYVNIHFECKNVTARYDGFRVYSSKIQFRDYDTQNWFTAWELGDWIDNRYQYIIFIESMIPLLLDEAIIDGGGNVAYNIEYTSNVEGQTIASKYWHSENISSGDLPTITPPTYYSFDGWYYDPLFIKKAKNGDIITSDVHLYGKIYLPSAIDIYLYENIDVNNSI